MEWVKRGILARASRPGYEQCNISADNVYDWVSDAKRMGIKTIICLLDKEHLSQYCNIGLEAEGLLDFYRKKGFSVIHYPIPDYQSPPVPDSVLQKIFAHFLSCEKPVLIHCSAGIDRTGMAVEYLQAKGVLEFFKDVYEMMENCSEARGIEHFIHVTDLSMSLYDQLQVIHKLDTRYGVILWAAAMLHDVGTLRDMGQNHGWDSADIILESGIKCFLASKEEIATVASLHKLSETSDNNPLGTIYERVHQIYPEGIPEQLQKIAAILRVADGFDKGLDQVVKRVIVQGSGIIIEPCDEFARINGKRKDALLRHLLGVHVK